YDQGSLVETEAGIVSLERRIEQLTKEFVAQQTQKMTEAAQRRDVTAQQVVKGDAKVERTRLISPIDGTVQQLGVTTVGQGVTMSVEIRTDERTVIDYVLSPIRAVTSTAGHER